MGVTIARAELISPIRQAWANLKNDPLVSTRQAAEILNCSIWTIRRLAHANLLRSVRVAGRGRMRYRQSDVMGLLGKGIL